MKMEIHISAAIAISGLLLSTASARAAIVYSGPINISFTNSLGVDIDGDGNFDLTFSFVQMAFGNPSESQLQVNYGWGEVQVIGWFFPDTGGVLALNNGTVIGPDLDPSLNWGSGFLHTMAYRQNYFLIPEVVIGGDWADVANMYLGFRLIGSESTNYGWLQMSVGGQVTSATVHDFAFDNSGSIITAGTIPVPVPLTHASIERPGYLRLVAETEDGKAYQVQIKDSLLDFAWSNLNFVLPASSTNTLVDLPMTGQKAFFRVVEAD